MILGFKDRFMLVLELSPTYSNLFIFVCTDLNLPELENLCKLSRQDRVYLELGLNIGSRVGLKLAKVGILGQNKAKLWSKLAQIGPTLAKWTNFCPILPIYVHAGQI